MSFTISKPVFLIAALLIAACLGLSAFSLYRSSPNRIAYVRSYDLINSYAGTLDARKEFAEKKSIMMANVDSLRVNVDRAAAVYQQKAPGLTPSQRAQRESELNTLHQQYLQYSAAIDEKIKEEDEKVMSAVLAQVNSFVEQYAKEQGINIVMGTTLSGSLLYGDNDLDITEPLLERLNNNFIGKK